VDEHTGPRPHVDTSGRVERTGIALLHEGDVVLPDPGSVAEVTPWPAADGDLPAARSEGPDEVHYWFPVEIEVVGQLDPAAADAVVARVYEELSRELSSRA
jgi:hypothetical protein